MGKYKVCVYAISKNEEENVDRWMDSMGEADIIAVTDTGSEDSTAEMLKKRNATVYIETITPWRFDKARNISLGNVPLDVDICVCTDLDEVFLPGWRTALEEAWDIEPATDEYAKIGKYLYNWRLKDGKPDVQFYYSKVHSRMGFRWKYPVHEVLRYVGTKPLKTVFINGMILNHYPDREKSRGHYLNLLETAVKESPNDDRMAYYLGREYMYNSRWEDSIRALKTHLSLPSSVWHEERGASMRHIAGSYYHMGRYDEAYKWYTKAIEETPGMREPYIEFALMASQLKDWSLALFLVEQSLKIKEKSNGYINMGYAWDNTPYNIAVKACYNLKLIEKMHYYIRLTPKNE